MEKVDIAVYVCLPKKKYLDAYTASSDERAEALAHYCAIWHCNIVKYYIDKDGNELQALIEAAHNNVFSEVIVWLERHQTRTSKEYKHIIEQLEENNIRFTVIKAELVKFDTCNVTSFKVLEL